MRTAPVEQHTLGLWAEPLPPMPRVLEGFERDDHVWVFEGERRTPARVIAVLRSLHQLVVRTDDHRLITITPQLQPGRILKRGN